MDLRYITALLLFLMKGNLKRSTANNLMAAQEQATHVRSLKHYIDKTTESPICGLCNEREETFKAIWSGPYAANQALDCLPFCFNYEVKEAAPKCIQIILPEGANLIDVVKRPIPNIDRFQLKQICRKLEIFESCFQDVVNLCDESQRKINILFKSMKASFRYLCDNGLESFSSAASCLNGDQVIHYLDECSEHSRAGIAKVPHSAHAISDEKHDVCHLINELVACATNVALMNCGTAAKNLTESVYRKHLTAIYHEWGCSYLSEEDILGITVAGAVIISIAVAISVYCCRRKTTVEPLPPGSPTTSSFNSRDYNKRAVIQMKTKSPSGRKDQYKNNYDSTMFDDDGFGSLGLRRQPREHVQNCLTMSTSRRADIVLD